MQIVSAPFKVGDICVLQNCEIFHENNGREATIMAMGIIGRHHGVKYFGCQLDFTLPNGFACVAQPHQLRRRKPPTSDTGEQLIISMLRDAKMPEGAPA